jgi:hypothetical protein
VLICGYFLWRNQQQITNLSQNLSHVTAQFNHAQTEILKAQQTLQDQQAALLTAPIYVDPTGTFSFWHDLPNINLFADDLPQIIVTTSDTATSSANGFFMTITTAPLLDQDLATIAEQSRTQLSDNWSTGYALLPKQINDLTGYSYARQINFPEKQEQKKQEKEIYLLTSTYDSTHYAHIEFEITAPPNSLEYEQFHQTITTILHTLKIY